LPPLLDNMSEHRSRFLIFNSSMNINKYKAM
jgi:hypothetical protein